MNTNNLLAGGNVETVTNPIFGKTSIFGNLINDQSGGSIFIGMVIPRLVGFIFVVGSISFLFMLLWGAVSWILSGGDKAHVESAKGRITNAVVGFILLIGSFAIVKLIETFFGIDILLIDIGPLVIQ